MKNSEFEYFAFISYSWADKKWARWLQRKLESFRLPSVVRKQHPDFPKRFRTIRDNTDIRSGSSLGEILHRELENSKYLIVVCSPRSAQSDWVGKEIQEFLDMGRHRQIFFFIVDGVPYSGVTSSECVHPVAKKHFPEALGANIQESGNGNAYVRREKAFIRLMAGILDLGFDSLWNRHRRHHIQKVASGVAAAIAVLALTGWIGYASQPFDVQIQAFESTVHNPHLPPLKDALVKIHLDNETKQGTLAAINSMLRLTNIPAKFRNAKVRLTFSCANHIAIDTFVLLSPRLTIPVERDSSVFGDLHARLYDIENERPVPHVTLSVNGQKTISDADGRIRLHIPLKAQRPSYRIEAAIPLLDTCVYMPCDHNTIIRTKKIKP